MLEVSTTAFVLVALVINSSAFPRNAPVLVTAKYSSTFKSTPRTTPFSGAHQYRVDCFLNGNVEVVLTVVLVHRGLFRLPFIFVPILLERRPFLVVWQDVLGCHAVANGSGRHVVVVVCGGAPAVHDDDSPELWFARVLVVFELMAVPEGVSDEISRGLNEA